MAHVGMVSFNYEDPLVVAICGWWLSKPVRHLISGRL